MNSSKIIYFFLSLSFASCLSHDDIISRQDEDLSNLIELNSDQINHLIGQTIKKTIVIDDHTETTTLKADSAFAKKEFSKIIALDIKKVFLNGEYDKSVLGQTITYRHKEKSTTGPIELHIEKDNNRIIINYSLKYQSSNYLFNSAFEFQIESKNSQITSYSIDAYQKLIGMDASKYNIRGQVL